MGAVSAVGGPADSVLDGVCSDVGADVVFDGADFPAVGANISDADQLSISKKRIRRRGVDVLNIPDNTSDYGRGVRSKGVNPCAGRFYCFGHLLVYLFGAYFFSALHKQLTDNLLAWELAEEALRAETKRLSASKQRSAELALKGKCF